MARKNQQNAEKQRKIGKAPETANLMRRQDIRSYFLLLLGLPEGTAESPCLPATSISYLFTITYKTKNSFVSIIFPIGGRRPLMAARKTALPCLVFDAFGIAEENNSQRQDMFAGSVGYSASTRSALNARSILSPFSQSICKAFVIAGF